MEYFKITKKEFSTKQLKLHGKVRKTEWKHECWTDTVGNSHESNVAKVEILDDNGDALEAYDFCYDFVRNYKTGQIGTFTFRMDFEPCGNAGEYRAHIAIVSFDEDKA